MFDIPHTYDLSFVSEQGMIHIVFTIPKELRDKFVERVSLLTTRYEDYAHSYCESEVSFALFLPTLFETKFGYEECGSVVEDDMNIHTYVALGPYPRAKHCALTIHVITSALLETEVQPIPDRPQQACIQTVCNDGDMNGHAMGGDISPQLLQWIQKHIPEEEAHARVPGEVVTAMQTAWQCITQKEIAFPDEFWGMLHSKGRFALGCPGDACDIAIYPDQMYSAALDMPSPFGCHNLDTAQQQLTLLAGLAKLCELARKEE